MISQRIAQIVAFLRGDVGAIKQNSDQMLEQVTTGLINVNVADLNGNNLDSNSGPTTDGTLRVVLPTDQSAIPITDNGGSVTIDGTVSATVSGTVDENLKQINGNTVSVGAGVSGTGTQRVILASDQSVIPINDNGSSITVDGTIASTQSGTWSVRITDGTDTANVSTAGNLGVQLNELYYPASTNNSTSGQLNAGQTWTGTIETIQNLQAAQVQVVCDQPYTLYVYQYIDAAGTKLSSTDTFTRTGGSPLNENVTLPGNYFRLALTNVGTAATTTLQVDTTFGIMNTTPRTLSNLGNLKNSLDEISGTAIAAGFGNSNAGTQRVVLAEEQGQDIEEIASSMRVQNFLIGCQLRLAIQNNTAGFIPIEIPPLVGV